MLKHRGIIGKQKIINTINNFQNIINDLQNGITNCNEEIMSSTKIIEAEQATITDLAQHIKKAEQLKNKISELLETK